jgi:hypothetical protein
VLVVSAPLVYDFLPYQEPAMKIALIAGAIFGLPAAAYAVCFFC